MSYSCSTDVERVVVTETTVPGGEERRERVQGGRKGEERRGEEERGKGGKGEREGICTLELLLLISC